MWVRTYNTLRPHSELLKRQMLIAGGLIAGGLIVGVVVEGGLAGGVVGLMLGGGVVGFIGGIVGEGGRGGEEVVRGMDGGGVGGMFGGVGVVEKLLPLVESPRDIEFLLSKVEDKTKHRGLLGTALNTALAEGRRQSFDVLFNFLNFDEKARKEWLTAVQYRASLTCLLEWMPGLMQEHLADVIKTGDTARAALLAECGISPAAAVLKNSPAQRRAL